MRGKLGKQSNMITPACKWYPLCAFCRKAFCSTNSFVPGRQSSVRVTEAYKEYRIEIAIILIRRMLRIMRITKKNH